MPDLIVAEKPSVARSIAEALGGVSRKGEGFVEASGWVITWAIGHLVDVGKPEDYDPKYKSWDLTLLPVMPDRFRTFSRSKDTLPQLKVIADQAKRCSTIVNACDAGREGEAIFRMIVQHLGIKNVLKRLWVSSLTKEAIVKALADLRPASEYDNLWASARVRNIGDWLVGMNATRAFSVRFSRPGDVYSVGRVQTPTLAILVKREREIRAFQSQDYFTIKAHLTSLVAPTDSFTARWEDASGNEKIADEATAQTLAAKIGAASPATVIDAKIEEVNEHQPQLYDLTTLQRECNRRFGFTAARTLEIAQTLYESKHITYPRTDCRYVSTDVARTFSVLVPKFLGHPTYAYLKGQLYPKFAQRQAVVNDSKISDHHAIIPTDVLPDVSKLKPDELHVYDLVVRRFLANFMPPALDRRVKLTLDAAGERLVAAGTREISAGWREADPKPVPSKPPRGKRPEGEEEEEEVGGPVPELHVGDQVRIDRVERVKKKTAPPKRYSEASLLGAMENAGKNLDDDALRDAMRGRGLGTPATRAAIIERLKNVGFVNLEKKSLVPTEKGVRLIELCEEVGVQRLASPELTGEWEQRLNHVADGRESAARLEDDLRSYTREIVQLVVNTSLSPAVMEGGSRYPPCPKCGGAVAEGRYDLGCNGCGVRVPKELLGRKLDEDDMVDLLTKGRTALLGGFLSKNKRDESGKPKVFAAVLVLNIDSGQVTFEFNASGVPKEPISQATGRSGGTPSGRKPVGGRRAGSLSDPPKSGRGAGSTRSPGTASGSDRAGASRSAGVGIGLPRQPGQNDAVSRGPRAS